MKKVLAIMGSPRTMKNTDYLLDYVLSIMESNHINIKKVNLKDLKISPCTACGYCETKGSCIIEDDMISLYDDFNNSDVIIVASPLYFNSVSSLTKIMIDRCQVFWSSKYILKESSIDRSKSRIGMFISVGGAPYRKDQFLGSTMVMDLFFKAINTDYKYNFLLSNTDKIWVGKRQEQLSYLKDMTKEMLKAID
ncbi:flavodoxin family protein [Clostridiisalibacter paucivorans]|uniref:flavodoxin family protein n=1 Tax=Clostridiisalibacter paucivorans TaxID=408753 RepID=UPI00047CE94D|nr:flavodoxin family protein [Clostridiisalibacter paucivorans]